MDQNTVLEKTSKNEFLAATGTYGDIIECLRAMGVYGDIVEASLTPAGSGSEEFHAAGPQTPIEEFPCKA